MSVFTNSGRDASANAAEYTRAVLGLLGDRDALEVLAELPAWLRRTVDAAAPETLRAPEAPGRWSVHQVLWHLADSEVINRYRLRASVASPGCTIVGYDQDDWAEELRYADADAGEALRLIEVLRPATVAWARGLDAERLERAGNHQERGAESVRHLLRMLAGHDLLHRAQIERILGAVAQPEPRPAF